jgi:pimeloyl-ACP methyl ester carboxylesterase
MRACQPSADGLVEWDAVKIHYEVYGEGRPTILLLPTWTLIHKRIWKLQVPYLSRHYRVVCYDGPGNGRSGRPLTTGPYEQQAQVEYALAVLDATGTERAVVVGLSRAANWALELAAEHPSRVSGLIVIGPSLNLGAVAPAALDDPTPDLEPSRVPLGGTDPPEHWAKYTRRYWLDHYEDFSWFFVGQCFPEPHSTKPIEDCVGWARETDGAVLVTESRWQRPTTELIEAWCARISCPLLAIHGTDDRMVPARRSEILTELTGGELALLEGSGHIPPARDPVRVNLLIKQFVDRSNR